MHNNSSSRFTVIKWVLIGLLIRFIVMPFAFHGHDIFWTNYAPFKLIEKGAWDPYLYIRDSYPQLRYGYYPPVMYYYISFFFILFRPLLAVLPKLYSIFESWNFHMEANTVQYAAVLGDLQLFRTLFLLKSPYLIADFVIGFFLLRYLIPDRKKSLLAFKIWMLNPFVLHSSYGLGQSDVVAVLFVMLAVLCIIKNRPYAAIILLAFSAGAKGYPFILIPPAILILGDNLYQRLKLSFVCLVTILAILLPFYLSSGLAFLGSFNMYEAFPLIRKINFGIGYLFLLLLIVFFDKRKFSKFERITLFSVLTLLLFHVTYLVTLRHFILITPFLIYFACRERKIWIFNAVFFITLFWLRTAGNTQQWGLFSALYPEFFSSLPIQDSFINLVFDVTHIHRIMFRSFVLAAFILMFYIIRSLAKGSFKIFAENPQNPLV